MKLSTFVLLFFIALEGYPQVRGITIDASTQEPVSYVNICVENKKIGTTSDLSGNFYIPTIKTQETLVFSSVGYERKVVPIKDSIVKVYLQPKIYNIYAIEVRPKKDTDKKRINKILKLKSNHYLICNGQPLIWARYFSNIPSQNYAPKISEVRILTRSDIQESKFIVRILSSNEFGEPDTDILNEPLIVEVKKGKNVVPIETDIYNLTIPENGIFVALEWLIIEENLSKKVGKSEITNSEYKVRYSPDFVAFPKKGDATAWVYSGGNWMLVTDQKFLKDDEHINLAIELVIEK